MLGDDDCVVGDGSRAIVVTSHGCNLNNSESFIALVTMTMMSFLCCRGSDADLCGVSRSVISALRTSGTQNSEVLGTATPPLAGGWGIRYDTGRYGKW